MVLTLAAEPHQQQDLAQSITFVDGLLSHRPVETWLSFLFSLLQNLSTWRVCRQQCLLGSARQPVPVTFFPVLPAYVIYGKRFWNYAHDVQHPVETFQL
jgi:hypothetical protein